ncbi:MAG: alpha/beta hydrolase [Gammaproteobacteria bacterium]|jgi:putative redox protein|nr:alpha/beta hydrolase [Gammaproteobacteria bacterium]
MNVNFSNNLGATLAGVIDYAKKPLAHAIFSHCFTCSKDHPATYRICKALANHGIQVLRFDYTGLGKSEGDFSDTDFSSNINDIIAAVNFLTENYSTPHLLIGHSLGGIAAVAAACELRNIDAVVTIAAPSRPAHVLDHFEEYIPTIIKQGFADVMIFDRPFRLTKKYIGDLKSYNERHFTRKLSKPILIFHSPYDDIVSIDEAAKIFTEAKHPKSFISLDQADHLISKQQDAEYIAEHIASWAKRYIIGQ